MQYYDYIILATLLLPVLYPLFFSQISRSTRELAKLNRITEKGVKKLNNGVKDYSEEIKQIQAIKWKYHKDKADLFLFLYSSGKISLYEKEKDIWEKAVKNKFI